MTAGKGVVHGEMFPLVHADKPNTLKLFQIWLNLPAKSKMVEPAFAMQWANQVQKVSLNDNAGILFFVYIIHSAVFHSSSTFSFLHDPHDPFASICHCVGWSASRCCRWRSTSKLMGCRRGE
jgi:redox-sensitive bicupin YhaK (pirin superfamily)